MQDSDSCDEVIDLIYSESEKEKLVKKLLLSIRYFIVIHYFSRQLQVDSGDFNANPLEEKPADIASGLVADINVTENAKRYRLKYYHGNLNLPILATSKKGYGKEQIVQILFNPQFDSRYLCSDHPTLVKNNTAFVINLKSKDDVRADDMGTWKCTGSRILPFYIDVDENECHIVSKNSAQCSFVKIRHQYHVHGTDPDLHRTQVRETLYKIDKDLIKTFL